MVTESRWQPKLDNQTVNFWTLKAIYFIINNFVNINFAKFSQESRKRVPHRVLCARNHPCKILYCDSWYFKTLNFKRNRFCNFAHAAFAFAFAFALLKIFQFSLRITCFVRGNISLLTKKLTMALKFYF